MSRLIVASVLVVAASFLASCGGGGGGGASSAGGGSTGGGGSGGSGGSSGGQLTKCSVCTNVNTELRVLTTGDRWTYTLDQSSSTVGPAVPTKTLDRVVADGPTYTAQGKSQATKRVTTTRLLNNQSEGSTYYDFVFSSNERRYRIAAQDEFIINTQAFINDNFPNLFLSPLGTGLSWSFVTEFIGPPSAGSSSNQVQQYRFEAIVRGIERIQTAAGTFDTYKVEYAITCRRGFVLVGGGYTPINLACVGEYLSETGFFWIYPSVGVIQNDYIVDVGSGSGGTFLKERIRYVARLTNTNFSYN